MDGFNIGNIILGLQNPTLLLKKLQQLHQQTKAENFAPELNSNLANSRSQQNQVLQNIQTISSLTQQLQMNTIPATDRSVFIKNLLGLPQNLSDVLLQIQNPNNPLRGGTLGLNNLNQELLQTKNAINALFDDGIQPQTNIDALTTNVQPQNVQIQKDVIALFFSGMISMGDVSKLILQNGKEAVASLIIAMATASKQGMNNNQIQETLKIVNSCISMAESNNPAQSLKSLMMLYIPWLPLNEGVGFDLEISSQDGETDSNESKLTVLIQTKNFGNLKGVFTLTTSNSVDIFNCLFRKFS